MKRRFKLTDLLAEGKFGPGSSKTLAIKDKAWKGVVGTTENKRRPEAIYIVFSTWVKPKLSVVKAAALTSDDPNDVARQAAMELESDLKRMAPKLRGFFDSLYFDVDSIIFTYDFAANAAAVGKAQFLEIEINIDTVNTIDSRDEPAPNPKTGAVEHLHFEQFRKPAEDAIKKLLSQPIFARSSSVEFQKTVRG